MRLEAWFVRLPMDEFLDAADSADQQEAEQFLVVVVAGGALVEVAAAPSAERRAAGCIAQPLRAVRPAAAGVGGAGSAIAATRHTSCRAGCSIPSGPPIGVGVSSDRPRSGRRTASGRGDARWCSRRVPERMAERVAGICAGDAEDEQALISAISYDDPGVARVPIPLERDRETSVLACVEFHKHDWLLPGFGHLIRGDGHT